MAFGENDPGTMPPMSIMCAEFVTQTTSCTVDEQRPQHQHVLGVQPAATVRIVRQEHVAGPDVVVAGERALHRIGGDVELVDELATTGDQPTAGIEDGGAVVATLHHDRADRRSLDGAAGLLRHGLEAVAEDLQLDDVQRRSRSFVGHGHCSASRRSVWRGSSVARKSAGTKIVVSP